MNHAYLINFGVLAVHLRGKVYRPDNFALYLAYCAHLVRIGGACAVTRSNARAGVFCSPAISLYTGT